MCLDSTLCHTTPSIIDVLLNLDSTASGLLLYFPRVHMPLEMYKLLSYSQMVLQFLTQILQSNRLEVISMTLEIGHAFIHHVPHQLRLPDRRWHTPVTLLPTWLEVRLYDPERRRSQSLHGHLFQLQICGLQTVTLPDLSSLRGPNALCRNIHLR